MTMKAYQVLEKDERSGDIYYAKHAITARKQGANEHADGDISSVECVRVPWADQFAPGPCPKLIMIDHGWWFECHGCGVKMQADAPDYCDSEDCESDVAPCARHDPQRYIEVGSAVYCSAECRKNYRAERAICKRLERRAIRELAAKLVHLIPGVTPVVIQRKDNWRPHAYASRQKDGSFSVEQCVVSFEFPGCKIGLGTYRYDRGDNEPRFYICNGDIKAWNEWRESQKADL